MTIQECLDYGYNILEENNLKDWTIFITPIRSYFGKCWYFQKKIEISLYHIETNPDEEIKQTILHEIAHAIAGWKASHGPVFMSTLKSLGGKPEKYGKGKILSTQERKNFNKFALQIKIGE